MATLIFACEYGTGLGSTSAFLPIADALREVGWHVEFALPHTAPGLDLVKHLLDLKSYVYFDAPGASVGASLTRSELVAAGPSFRSPAVFRHDLDFWLEQICTLQADVLVVDHAILPLIAARIRGVRCAAVDRGFFHEPRDENDQVDDDPQSDVKHTRLGSASTVPGLASAAMRKRLTERHVLDIVAQSLRQLGKPVPSRFSELFIVDKLIRLNSPALVPRARRDASAFIGMPRAGCWGEKPTWPQSSPCQPKIFVYLKFHLGNVSAILAALQRYTTLSAIVCIPDLSGETARKYLAPHLRFTSEILDMRTVFDDADVVICNAGAVIVAQALAAGKPLLLAPYSAEQQLTAVAAAGSHVAVLLPLDIGEQQVRERLNALLESTFANGLSFTACARAHMRQNKQTPEIAIASQLNELAPQQPLETQTSSWRTARLVRRRVERFADYDVVFLSFDEPNAAAHWKTLSLSVGNAVRVHGVKGFDAAHKAAAAASTTERFILIDGDNQMDASFFDIETSVPALFKNATWQWSSVNSVTGLAYPFGGPKIWTRTQINAMRSHEACKDRADPMATDFWSQPGYHTFQQVFSTNATNASPYQAFRSAFREGAKLAAWNGLVRSPADFVRIAKMPQSRRAAIWMSVGADVPNGVWSLLGARLGFISYFDASFEHAQVGEYGWFDSYWNVIFNDICGEQCASGKETCVIENEALRRATVAAGDQVRAMIGGSLVIDMTVEQSARFKQVMRSRRQIIDHLFKPFGLMDGF